MKIRYFCKPKKFFFISRQDLSKWSLLFIKSIQTLAWAHLSTACTATHFIVDLKIMLKHNISSQMKLTLALSKTSTSTV